MAGGPAPPAALPHRRCHKIVNISNDLRGASGSGVRRRNQRDLFAPQRALPSRSIYDNTSLYQREAVEIRTTLD
jgi:hypothetical protein